jgi:hypothetical protein
MTGLSLARRRARTLAGGALAVVVVLSVAGCGGEEQARDDYCAQLRTDQAKFSEMFASGDPSSLLDNVAMLDEVADKAPADLRDEWQTLLNAVHGLDDALARAGVEPHDFQSGKQPVGLSARERKAISDAADALTSRQVLSSASGIDQQARDVCKIQLGM